VNPLESKENKIAGFIYKAQVLQESVNDLSMPKANKSELSFESVSKKVSLSYFDSSLVDNAKKMSAVYIAIASFENMLRGIVVEKLLIEKGENWWNSDAISSDIRRKADNKLVDEKQNRWHTPRGISPIYFTELKDLVSIICKPQNWEFFEDLFGDPDWVRHSIKSLERSRNVIMHSGQLTLEDIERVGIVIRDWIRQVGG
jgi:hypothetical protein